MSNLDVSIRNKIFLVTGGSRGIGRELSISLAKEGAFVIINYNTNTAKATDLLNFIKQFNKNCMIYKADVSNGLEVKKMYQAVMKVYGKIDVLINNAGICEDNLLIMMSDKQWNTVLDVNLTGVFNCCKWFSRSMIKENSGKIINITSLRAEYGCKGQSNYSASKAGVIALTKSLAKEFGQFNICVNAVSPNFIESDLTANTTSDYNHNNVLSSYSSNKSLEEFINFLVYISSDKFTSVSGRVFNIDSRLK